MPKLHWKIPKMGTNIFELAEKLTADPNMRRDFTAVCGGRPDAGNILDAIASFERTLVTQAAASTAGWRSWTALRHLDSIRPVQ
jgi:hypothetical protein